MSSNVRQVFLSCLYESPREKARIRVERLSSPGRARLPGRLFEIARLFGNYGTLVEP